MGNCSGNCSDKVGWGREGWGSVVLSAAGGEGGFPVMLSEEVDCQLC